MCPSFKVIEYSPGILSLLGLVPQTQLIIRKSSENEMRFLVIDNFQYVIAVEITCHK